MQDKYQFTAEAAESKSASISEKLSALGSSVGSFFTGIGDGISSGISAIGSFFTGIGSSISAGISKVGSMFASAEEAEEEVIGRTLDGAAEQLVDSGNLMGEVSLVSEASIDGSKDKAECDNQMFSPFN